MTDLNTLAEQLDEHMAENDLTFSRAFRHLNDDNFGIDDMIEAMIDAQIDNLADAIADMTEIADGMLERRAEERAEMGSYFNWR